MSINIPDSVPKLLVLIGIICLAVGIYGDKEITEKYDDKFDEFNKIQDSVTLEKFVLTLEKRNLLERALQLSQSFNIENPIKEKDSVITFNRVLSGDVKRVILSDSLYKYWNKYKKDKYNLDILLKKKEIQLKNIDSEEGVLYSRKEFYGLFILFGSISFVVGVFIWDLEDSISTAKTIKQNEKIYKFCQSCGFKFSSIRPYGTEKDKTENLAFCIECYKKGKLREPEMTKEDFINRKKNEIRNKSWLFRVVLMKRFYRLERWNKDSYF